MHICKLYDQNDSSSLPYAHVFQLVPPAGTDLHSHLHGLIKNELPTSKFEECMIEFLDGLLQGQPTPILVQVEMGKVDGLSRRESRAVLNAMDIA